MAKPKKPGKKKRGPYLAAAFFCERTIQDKQDDSLSAIRIVDQLTIGVAPSAPPDFPSEADRISFPTHALLSFKTGDSQGDHNVRCVMESPSGKSSTVFDRNLPFSPQPNGG